VTDSDLVGRRVAAGLIDVLIVFGLFLIVGFTIGESDTSESAIAVELGGVATLVWIALAFAYYFGTETRWARTVGKRALGLRVERLDGRPPTRGPVAVRTLLRAIDVLPILYLIGFMVVLTAGKGRQRLGDLAAGTAVVRG
jgi:uncharacterized RDD family membrane protein YckC